MMDQGRARRRARGAFFTSNAAILACAALAVGSPGARLRADGAAVSGEGGIQRRRPPGRRSPGPSAPERRLQPRAPGRGAGRQPAAAAGLGGGDRAGQGVGALQRHPSPGRARVGLLCGADAAGGGGQRRWRRGARVARPQDRTKQEASAAPPGDRGAEVSWPFRCRSKVAVPRAFGGASVFPVFAVHRPLPPGTAEPPASPMRRMDLARPEHRWPGGCLPSELDGGG